MTKHDKGRREFIRYLALTGSTGLAASLAGCTGGGGDGSGDGGGGPGETDSGGGSSDGGSTTGAAASSDQVEEWTRKAKEEENGRLVIYHTLAGETMDSFTSAVEEQFPWMNIEHPKLSAQQVETRFMTEYRSGNVNADAVWGRSWNIVNEGMAMDLTELPNYADLPEEARGGTHWAPFKFLVFSGFYNTDLMSDSEVPSKWSDFLDPKYKEQFIVSTSTRPMWLRWAEKNVDEDFIEKIGEQNPQVTNSSGTAVVQTAAGQRPLDLYGFLKYLWIEDRGGNSPVDTLPVKRVLGPTAFAVSNEAPHPNTAKVFHNWYFSEEGAQTQAEFMVNECMGTLENLVCNPDEYQEVTRAQEVELVSNTVDVANIDREAISQRWGDALGV